MAEVSALELNIFMIKNTIKRILPIFLVIAIISLAYLPQFASACLSNVTSGSWVNCTIYTNQTPTNDLVNTLSKNAPFGWFLIYVTIYISIAIFLLIQDRSFARFNYITMLGLIVALVFKSYNLVGNNVITISAALLGLSIFASIFLR